MFHPGTQTLIDAWALLPDARRIPSRASVDPAAFGLLLPQVFLAERRGEGVSLRLTGGWIEAFHGRPQKGRAWLSQWRRESLPLVASAIGQAFREARPVVVIADAVGEPLEIAFAPLRGPEGAPDRLIGLYQPTTPQGRRLEGVSVLTARLSVGVGESRRAPLSLAALDGRRIA
jgi:hypothetical protein